MRDLATFGVDDLVALSEAFQRVSAGASTMTGAAQAIVEHLQAEVRHAGEPAVALARLYKTHPLAGLPPELQAFASDLHGGEVPAPTPCLTLLGSAGVVPDWNDPRRSIGHQAIPIPGPAALARLPMVAALFDELGVAFAEVLAADPTRQAHHRDHHVFFVEDARGSDVIPAQADFVVPYGIRSVLGVGGFLPSGDLFALLLFLTAQVGRGVADLFRTVALSVKATLVPFTYRVFTDG